MACRPFVFMYLPAEVREMIYSQIYKNGGGSTVRVHENERATDHVVNVNRSSGADMLCTCRSVYNELLHHRHRHLDRQRLVFRTQVRNAGYEATERLPRLGQQITGALFAHVTTVVVGATDLWRVVTSLGSLKTRLKHFQCIETVVVKRMPYRYWKERFLHVVASMVASRSGDDDDDDAGQVSRACRADSDRGTIPELELARFRCHVRSHPLINEDEHYVDDDEDGYTEDKGCEVFARPGLSAQLADRGLRLHVCGRWFLVERRANSVVKLIVETSFDLASGRILDVRLIHSYLDVDEAKAARCTQPLLDLERQTVDEKHTLPA